MINLRISIITVVFNDVGSIENTMLSVINQTYNNIEYIIIDGGSTDGTKDIINKFISNISYYISESDTGIYDAMNKGINLATGNYILFLNSGDIFHSQEVIYKIFSIFKRGEDVIYGNTLFVSNNFNKLIRPVDMKNDWKSIPYCHQSVFISSKVLKRNLFDTSYKIAADYDQYFNLKISGCSFKYVDEIISIYDTCGFSSQNYLKLLYEYKIISLKNQNSILKKIFIWIYFKFRVLKNIFS